jgi:chemotaxis protein MotB
MFWTDRLKQADANADGSWMLSYGDLMSLLLVIFVMVAAMSELQAGDRFGRMSEGVRQAFGFSGSVSAFGGTAEDFNSRPLTLLERLEEAGFQRESSVQLRGPDDEFLAPCDLIVGESTLTVRIAGHAAFSGHSAALQPAGEKALRRMAEYLAGGTCRLEVRGHSDHGPLPEEAAFRDGMDLSYARARAVADVLAGCGVARERLFITAWAEHAGPDDSALVADDGTGQANAASPPSMPEGAERRIEIIVHAVSAAGHDQSIAGKDQGNDG